MSLGLFPPFPTVCLLLYTNSNASEFHLAESIYASRPSDSSPSVENKRWNDDHRRNFVTICIGSLCYVLDGNHKEGTFFTLSPHSSYNIHSITLSVFGPFKAVLYFGC